MNNRYAGYAGRMYDELVAAESRLAGARENFRAAVKETGRPTDGIFGSTSFVPRSLLQSKLQDMEAANSRSLKAALAQMGKNDGDDDDQDDTGDRDDRRDTGDDAPRKRTKKKAKPIKEDEDIGGGEDEAPSRPVDNSPSRRTASYDPWVRAQAAAICRAGARARGIAAKPPSQAAAIYESNLRVYDASRDAGLPYRPTWKMIVDAGRRARNLPLED